jgi:tetratricopeptide (TPR) repeat protein
MVDSDRLSIAKTEYETGKQAFERGMYRESVQAFEKANALLAPNTTRFAGEVQIWLATAYEAAGDKENAIALCQKASRHPDYETRKQGQRLLYILQAPQLTRRPEWLTQIPDLNEIQEGESKIRAAGIPTKQRPPEPRFKVTEPIDPTQVNTKDNRFIWVALVATVLILGGLVWFS